MKELKDMNNKPKFGLYSYLFNSFTRATFFELNCYKWINIIQYKSNFMNLS